MRIETLAAQGWIARPFSNIGGDVRLEKIPTTMIYVDNRGQEEATLVCGQLSFDVRPDSKERFRIPTHPPGESVPMSLAGKAIGSLDSQNILVDPLGTRSYRVRTLTYVGGIEMVIRMAERATGMSVRILRFQEMNYRPEFDGVWACASLLHVPQAELSDAIARLTAALKSNGVLYVSFKRGNGGREYEGRRFTDSTVEQLRAD